jgi:hypothetical protein
MKDYQFQELKDTAVGVFVCGLVVAVCAVVALARFW